jgi:hypothetical protein
MADEPIRCKFLCVAAGAEMGWGDQKLLWSYRFQAVVDGSEENKRFWAATPSGSVELHSVQADVFAVGREYYLDFREVGDGA